MYCQSDEVVLPEMKSGNVSISVRTSETKYRKSKAKVHTVGSHKWHGGSKSSDDGLHSENTCGMLGDEPSRRQAHRFIYLSSALFDWLPTFHIALFRK